MVYNRMTADLKLLVLSSIFNAHNCLVW